MGPPRKSRSVNKRFSYINEVSPSKDGESNRRSNNRKRKLADMLGSQWSKEELSRFYEAYRKYGKDWKKVAAVVRNRSAEMVEALYTMNRAYLSLPEGTASVAGLIAMMTDHYCNLAGSDSEQESNEGAGTSRKPQKRVRGKIPPTSTKASDGNSPLHSQAIASSSGCLSLLKKKRTGGSRPRAVGKRTPRFPVSYSYETVHGEKYFSATRPGLKIKADANDDEVAHEIALALAEASHKGGSPQVSQTPNRRRDSVISSPIHNVERKCIELEMVKVKHVNSDVEEDDLEGSMEADTGELSRYRNDLVEAVGTVAEKGKRFSGRRLEVDESSDNHLDDIKEACSGTEEGQRLGAVRGKSDIEVMGTKLSGSSSQGPRKRSKKVLFRRDENMAFDALQTLADLSLMMPETADEDESMVHVKDENDDHIDESGSLEVPVKNERERRKSIGFKGRADQTGSRFEVAPSTTSKSGKISGFDDSSISEAKQEPHPSATKLMRKKQKILASKIRKAEAHPDIHLSESKDSEVKDAGKKSVSKGKRSSQSASPKQIKNPEHSSTTGPRKEGSDSAQSTVQIPAGNKVHLPTKVRSRRKTDLKNPQTQRDLKFPEKVLDSQTNMPCGSFQDRAVCFKEKLSNCLSNHRVRRWCTYEWFYSAIDYPWFAKREFVEYLYHVGLGHVPRLTRVEWGVIRSSLGKPRRFSEQFLKEEKEKLNQYRDSVRKHYTELRDGIREGLPTDLARPLSVGQRVIAIHPRTREIHDGSVLTVDHARCRVQFDRPELGVEFVTDIDCMPLNPFENMPKLLTRPMDAVDRLFENLSEFRMNGRSKEYLKSSSGDNMEGADALSHLSPSIYPISNLLKQTKITSTNDNVHIGIGPTESVTNQLTPYTQPCALAHIQAKEADIQALAELTRALDKKEAVVSELKRMNDDVLESQKGMDNPLRDSEPFKMQYAAVIVQLQEVNKQVTSALCHLRQRNTYQGSIPVTWPRSFTNFDDPGGALSPFDRSASHPQDSGAQVSEIIESSRLKARTMVDAAMEAMSSFNAKENTVEKIEEAITYVHNRLPLDDSSLPAVADSKLKNASEKNETQVPSELITQCVATLLMIQKCTERQFPPADVAQILDSAVTSLQPCCSQNLPVYAEIQKYMGIIRNQILALIPTSIL